MKKRVRKFAAFVIAPLFVVAIVPVWKTAASTNTGDKTILFPVYGDCQSFYSLSNDVFIRMSCPDGLYFNDKLDVCDWPNNVDREDCF